MSPREAELTSRLEQALQLTASLQRENQLLREKINLLVRRVFGSSSEIINAAQLLLVLSGSQLVEPATEQELETFKPATACLDTVVPVDFKGTVQCDRYAAHNQLATRPDKAIKLANCWAHVRRKFHDALASSPKTGGWVVKQIRLLYRIESGLRERKAGPAKANRLWSGSRKLTHGCFKAGDSFPRVR